MHQISHTISKVLLFFSWFLKERLINFAYLEIFWIKIVYSLLNNFNIQKIFQATKFYKKQSGEQI